MAKSIRLSKQHGVNPTLGVCFWCGEDTGELALMGYMGKGDPEAPKRMVLNYNPCPKCAELWAQGCACIEATEVPNGRPEIQPGAYPTGAVAVLKREAADRLGIPGPRVLMDPEVFGKLFR